MVKGDNIYLKRLERHHDELRWLYMELYDNDSMFAELSDNMRQFYLDRNKELKKWDEKRASDPSWYKQNDLLGMMFYIDNFAGNMKGVESKLDYIEQCNVNYIHLMPFLDTPEGRSDGGYAVSDFRKVQEKLGSMKDLDSLTAACHKGHQCLYGFCYESYLGGSRVGKESTPRGRRVHEPLFFL